MTGAWVGALVACLVLLGRPGIVISYGDRAAVGAARHEQDERSVLTRLRMPLALLAAIAGWIVCGGLTGLALGAVAGIVAWRVLSTVEPPEVGRRRRALERDLPMAVHLLGAALAAGSTTSSALALVADSLPGPVADDFRLAHHRLALGLDPVQVWRSLDGALEQLGRSMARAHQSGSSVVATVDQVASGLGAQARVRREALARSVEVRASAPLGLCFLPAFLLVGVVPMVVGIFSSVRLFA